MPTPHPPSPSLPSATNPCLPSLSSSLPSIRTHYPQYKKTLANARFFLRKTSFNNLFLNACTLLLPAILIVALIHYIPLIFSISVSLRTPAATYVDPCTHAVPHQLFHFDPSYRASREFSSFLRRDVDPPTYNRIFAAFFSVYLFEPASDVVVNLNATARGRPTDIRNGLRDAQVALRRYFNDPTLAVINYTLAYDHLDRVRGSRTIFHLHSRNATSHNLHHAVAIQRTFDGICRISVRNYPNAFRQPVYIILPYSRRPRRLRWFLDQMQYLVTVSHVSVRLVIAVCNVNATDVAHVRTAATASRIAPLITVVETPGDKMRFFSRAVAIREAVMRGGVPDDAVMFISDVDMYIFAPMFNSCRSNAIRGSQVYFPVFYSLYARNERIARSGGYWRDSSLGMSCMYKSDFVAVDAYKDAETRFVGWGVEDRALSEAFKKDERYEVFRAVEPALRHKWHLKHCEPLTPAYEDCLSVTFQQLGDMKAVGRFLLENKFDAQKFYAKFADEFEDEKYGGIIVDEEETTDEQVLERRRRRREQLKREKEEKKQQEILLEKEREMEWRKRTGITKEKEEEIMRKEQEEGEKMAADEDDDEDEARERAKDLELMREAEEQDRKLKEEQVELKRISDAAGAVSGKR